jgi:hypothetical protein
MARTTAERISAACTLFILTWVIVALMSAFLVAVALSSSIADWNVWFRICWVVGVTIFAVLVSRLAYRRD